MKILIACEYSGRVRDAFIAMGHEAMSCDLLPTDVPGPHYQGDIRDIINDGWDMMIAFPPCTYLCSSGLHWNKRGIMVEGRPRQEHTDEAVEFVRMLLEAPIPRVAVENPIGCLSSRLRKPDQIIQPWHFGDDASKSTCLWLKGLPKLDNTDRSKWIPGRIIGEDKRGKTIVRWSNQCDSGQNKLGPSEDRWKLRSETYMGIARAMASQWGSPGLPAPETFRYVSVAKSPTATSMEPTTPTATSASDLMKKMSNTGPSKVSCTPREQLSLDL